MSHYCDILWVEDFDTQDESVDEEETETKRYYDSGKRKYSFRVNLQREVLPILKHLEDEKNFSSYSCAVLDINLTEGFGCDPNESEVAELREIKEILRENKIEIRSEHEKDNDKFKENAGYYVYLYLVNRGMPPSHICMLTGNQGEGNLTGNWKKIFESAGIMPPKDFAKDKAGIKDFHYWLEGTLTSVVRLRACIIGMSFYAEKLLDSEITKLNTESDENKRKEILHYEETKTYVQNLYRIPLRLSQDEETASPEFISALWQIVQPYDSKESFSFGSLENAYQTTLTTTRNWFAHNCLKEVPPCLLTVAFLFGIGMRNLLKKILATGDVQNKEYRNEYRRWEDELIVLLESLDGKVLPKIDKITSKLVMKSCKEFSDRIKNSRIPLMNDISKIIHEIGQKHRNLERRDTDLLRDFLHGFYPLKEGVFSDNGIRFEFDERTFNARKNKIEAQYLEAVKNTLALAVNRK